MQKASLLQPWVWDAAEHDEPMRTTYGQELEQAGHGSPARRQAVLLHRINLESLLSRLDSATMLSGLEARVPYTDHRLVEYGFRLPFEYHLNVASDETSPFLAAGTLDARGSLRSKRILREIARRRLPSLLANRPKQSFPTPVSRWLAGPWNSWAFQSLQNSPFAQDFFTPVALRGLVEAARVQPMAVWPILNLTSWGDRTYFHRQADPLEIGRQSSISAGQPLPAA